MSVGGGGRAATLLALTNDYAMSVGGGGYSPRESLFSPSPRQEKGEVVNEAGQYGMDEG